MKTTYTIDPAHSGAHFTVRHMMITNVRGAFRTLKGTVVYDPENPAASSVEAEIEAASIDTRESQRDAHLRSADFLDVEKFPAITFRSTEVEPSGEGEWKVTGDLTIHGVTRAVVLNVEGPLPEGKDPWGNLRSGASATAKIKRSDFGLTWNAALETGGFLVGDELKIELELALVRAADASKAA
jgi:polyisoprenoid-binding protein YceI